MARRIMRGPRPSASGCWRSCGRSTAGRSTCGLGRRWPPSIWRAKTGSRCITTRCAGGCWPRGCGVARGNGRPIAQRRERKAHFGELVQLDGSFHLWYEARAPRGCLMNLVDDATGRTLARLGAQETIWAAVDVLRRWIEAYGVPLALYTDWKNVYVREPNAEEQATGAVPLTQFGRMCAALGIQIIAASSPQAKGRVERNHGTHQDRLVKKLRRLGIADAAAANAFLETTYLPEHNARFAQAPGVGRRLSSADAESDSRSIGCCSSRRRASCPTTG